MRANSSDSKKAVMYSVFLGEILFPLALQLDFSTSVIPA